MPSRQGTNQPYLLLGWSNSVSSMDLEIDFADLFALLSNELQELLQGFHSQVQSTRSFKKSRKSAPLVTHLMLEVVVEDQHTTYSQHHHNSQRVVTEQEYNSPYAHLAEEKFATVNIQQVLNKCLALYPRSVKRRVSRWLETVNEDIKSISKLREWYKYRYTYSHQVYINCRSCPFYAKYGRLESYIVPYNGWRMWNRSLCRGKEKVKHLENREGDKVDDREN